MAFIEEGIESGGISETIAARLVKAGAQKKTKIFAVNGFVGQGTTEELFGLCGFDPEKIYENITEKN